MVQTFRKVMLAAALVLALASCGRKETLATLSVEGDQEVEEVFSLARRWIWGPGILVHWITKTQSCNIRKSLPIIRRTRMRMQGCMRRMRH